MKNPDLVENYWSTDKSSKKKVYKREFFNLGKETLKRRDKRGMMIRLEIYSDKI